MALPWRQGSDSHATAEQNRKLWPKGMSWGGWGRGRAEEADGNASGTTTKGALPDEAALTAEAIDKLADCVSTLERLANKSSGSLADADPNMATAAEKLARCLSELAKGRGGAGTNDSASSAAGLDAASLQQLTPRRLMAMLNGLGRAGGSDAVQSSAASCTTAGCEPAPLLALPDSPYAEAEPEAEAEIHACMPSDMQSPSSQGGCLPLAFEDETAAAPHCSRPNSAVPLEKLSVKELQRRLDDLGVVWSDCVEKSELVARLQQADPESRAAELPALKQEQPPLHKRRSEEDWSQPDVDSVEAPRPDLREGGRGRGRGFDVTSCELSEGPGLPVAPLSRRGVPEPPPPDISTEGDAQDFFQQLKKNVGTSLPKRTLLEESDGGKSPKLATIAREILW